MAAPASAPSLCKIVSAQDLAKEICKDLEPWEKTATKVDFIFLRLEFRLNKDISFEFDPLAVEANRESGVALYTTNNRSQETWDSIKEFKTRLAAHQQILNLLVSSNTDSQSPLTVYHAAHYQVRLHQEEETIAHLAYRFDTSLKRREQLVKPNA